MLTVKEIFKLPKAKHTKGEVGIEVEVEGKRLPKPDLYWACTTDGSLSAEEAIEYVLAEPMSRDGAIKALQFLQDCYTTNKTKVDDSVRAGVHIHINVQHMNMLELYNFMCLYLVLEELLVNWCGPTRVGNLFCLRATDAEWLTKVMADTARSKEFIKNFHDDDIRYASMNLKSLTEHGSLEFRSMRGVGNLSLVGLWMDMLLQVRDASKQFEDPIDLITGFSGCDKGRFIDNIMGKYAAILKEGVDYNAMLFSGMRNAQDVAYALKDWSPLAKIKFTNPFKREEFAVQAEPTPAPPRERAQRVIMPGAPRNPDRMPDFRRGVADIETAAPNWNVGDWAQAVDTAVLENITAELRRPRPDAAQVMARPRNRDDNF